MQTELTYNDYILLYQALQTGTFRGSDAINIVNLTQKVYAKLTQGEKKPTQEIGRGTQEEKEVETTQDTEPLQVNE